MLAVGTGVLRRRGAAAVQISAKSVDRSGSRAAAAERLLPLV